VVPVPCLFEYDRSCHSALPTVPETAQILQILCGRFNGYLAYSRCTRVRYARVVLEKSGTRVKKIYPSVIRKSTCQSARPWYRKTPSPPGLQSSSSSSSLRPWNFPRHCTAQYHGRYKVYSPKTKPPRNKEPEKPLFHSPRVTVKG